MRHLLIACSALALLAAPALATETVAPAAKTAETAPAVTILTEEVIQKFYQESKDLYQKPYAEYEAYMEAHTDDAVQIKLDIVSYLPGKPEIKQSVLLDKKKFMASNAQNYKASQGAKIDHKIASVYIGKDGKSAQVTDVTMLSKSLTIPGQVDKGQLDVQSQSTCEDIIGLSSAGVIQIKKSTCTAETYFFPKK